MQHDFIRRVEELYRRSALQHMVTHSGFLTPAEQYSLKSLPHLRESLHLSGGGADCERQVAFFLPDYLTAEDFNPQDYIRAFQVQCRFNPPSHRDILGSLLALGLARWSLGDIYTQGEAAWFFCLPSVSAHIQGSLERVGRGGARVWEIPLDQVPLPPRLREPVAFTVSSPRLDALLAGTFGLSREKALGYVEGGLVSLHYSICLKPATLLHPGDVFSLQGYGKAALREIGGKTRKDRLRVLVEKYR